MSDFSGPAPGSSRIVPGIIKEDSMRTRSFPSIFFVSAAVAFLAGPARAAEAAASVSATVTVDTAPRDFRLAVCKHYAVEEAVIVRYRERHIPDDHLPVVFLIAGKAKVAPEAVVELRLGGESWMDICLHYGLSPAIFHVEVEKPYGPPYGNAFGHFKNHPRAEWATLRLPDTDIVLLANVHFLSAFHGFPADRVMELRIQHGDFLKANGGLALAKANGKGNGNGAEGKGKAGKGASVPAPLANQAPGAPAAGGRKAGSPAAAAPAKPDRAERGNGGGGWSGQGRSGGGGKGGKGRGK